MASASPSYLREHGVPKTLEDFAKHRLVHYTQTLGVAPLDWEHFDGERSHFTPMRGVITVNNSDA